LEDNEQNQEEQPVRHISVIERFPGVDRPSLILWVVILGLRFVSKEVLGEQPDEHATSFFFKLILILYRILSVFITLICAFSLGNFTRRTFFPSTGDSIPVYFSIGLGFVVISYGTFLFLIKTPITWILLLVVAVGVVLIVIKETKQFLSYLNPRHLSSLWKHAGTLDYILIAAFPLLLLPPLLEVFTPPYSWDAVVYHLTIPKIYLAHQGFGYIHLNVYSNMPMNVDMLYVFCMRLADDVVCKMLHFSLGLLLLCTLINFSRRHLQSWRPGALAGIVLITNPMINYEFGVAFIDVGMTFLMALAFYAAIEALRAEDKRSATGWLILSGIFCGFLAGSKYTGTFSAVSITAVLLSGYAAKKYFRFTITLRSLVTAILVIALCVFLLLVPWLAKNYILTHNPVYPMFYNLFDGKDWSSWMARQLIDWQHNIGQGRSFIDYVLLPFRIFTISKYDYDHFAGPMCPALLIALIASLILCPRENRKWLLLLLAGFAGFFIPWSTGAQQVRFLMPSLPLLAMASALFISQKQRTDLLKGVAILVVLVIIGFGVYYNFNQFRLNAKNLSMIFGSTPRSEFIESRIRSYRCFKHIEQLTKKNETVVLLYENKGYYLNRPFLTDAMYETSYFVDRAAEFGSPELFKQMLLNSDIRYVLINEFIQKDVVSVAMGEGFFEKPELNRRYARGIKVIESFIDTSLEPVYSHYGSTVYLLRR